MTRIDRWLACIVLLGVQGVAVPAPAQSYRLTGPSRRADGLLRRYIDVWTFDPLASTDGEMCGRPFFSASGGTSTTLPFSATGLAACSTRGGFALLLARAMSEAAQAADDAYAASDPSATVSAWCRRRAPVCVGRRGSTLIMSGAMAGERDDWADHYQHYWSTATYGARACPLFRSRLITWFDRRGGVSALLERTDFCMCPRDVYVAYRVAFFAQGYTLVRCPGP